jgi:AcrR family transcriptional regulator
MDARALRTRELLERTVLDLASRRPLRDISVTDIARTAGITRPTFYAHADSPGDLLAMVLGRQLDRIGETAESAPDGRSWPDAPQRALVDHVMHNASIYRRNLDGRLPHEVRNVLIDHTERALINHFLRHPALLPQAALGTSAQDPEDLYRRSALFAEMAASGTVAALEVWLRGPDPLDPAWAVEALRRGSAQWMQMNADSPAGR